MDSIGSVGDLFEALDIVHQEFHRGQLWWRGQAQRWPLLPSVHRVSGRGPYERGVCLHFRGEAPSRYQHCPAPTDLPGWLFLMQHHGVPTRLLDWSGSALCGLYFAVREKASDDHDGVLFALDPWSLNKLNTGHEATLSSYELGPLFEAAFSHKPAAPKWETTVAITTEGTNPRVVAQQGRFTIDGSRRPMDEHPDESKFLRVWTIPADAKPRIRKELGRVGIQEHRLFPDLDHLAAWIKAKCFCGENPCPHGGTLQIA